MLVTIKWWFLVVVGSCYIVYLCIGGTGVRCTIIIDIGQIANILNI